MRNVRVVVGAIKESFESGAVGQHGELHPIQVFAELSDIPSDGASLAHVLIG